MSAGTETYATLTPRIVAGCNCPDAGRVLVADYELQQGENFFGAFDTPMIWGYLTPTESEVRVGSTNHGRQTYSVGDLRLVRSGVRIRRVPDRASTIRGLVLPKTAIRDALGDRAPELEDAFGCMEHQTFRSPMIELLIDRLACAQEPRDLPMYCQSMVHSLVFELWRIAGMSKPQKERREGICAAALDRIDQFVLASKAEKIDLNALAKLAGMPVSTFSRAFKTMTGKTPYQHVVALRLSKARRLISSTSLSLAEVAYQAGFSSQSHMTDVFTSKLGVTPGAIRKELA